MVGDQDWDQETWVRTKHAATDLLCEPDEPTAITDIYTGWPSRETFGSWPEASSRAFIQLRALVTLSLIHPTLAESLFEGQACLAGHGRPWPDLLPRSFQTTEGKGQ